MNGAPFTGTIETLSEVIASVEKVKGERWVEFRDRHGDSGRDLVLYLGRRRCGLKLQELAGAAGMTDYSTGVDCHPKV